MLFRSYIPNVKANGFYALAVPREVPSAIVSKIHQDMIKVIAKPEMQQKLSSLHLVPLVLNAEEFNRWADTDIAKLQKLIKEFGPKPN